MQALPHTVVYIEGGYSDLNTVAYTAKVLNAIGVSKIRGFFTNDTHDNWTSLEVKWATAIAKRTHGAHFIVNTASNGRGALRNHDRADNGNEDLCNPPGRGLGPRDTTNTGFRSPTPGCGPTRRATAAAAAAAPPPACSGRPTPRASARAPTSSSAPATPAGPTTPIDGALGRIPRLRRGRGPQSRGPMMTAARDLLTAVLRRARIRRTALLGALVAATLLTGIGGAQAYPTSGFTIFTIAGNGTQCSTAPSCGDGGPATSAEFARPGRGGRGQLPATRSCLIAMTKRSGRSRRPARSRGSPATGCPLRKPGHLRRRRTGDQRRVQPARWDRA